MKIRKFELSDAEKLCPKAIEESLSTNESFWRQWAMNNLKSGPAYTGYIGDEIICSAGIRLLDDKGYVWAVFSENLKRYRFSAFRCMKMMLKILVDEFELKGLIADSQKGFLASQRLLEHLGFRKVDETETHYFYVRI